MQLKLVTDNEWEGKYELLEKEHEADGLDIVALGDLLPTGSRKQVGGKSHFKTNIKALIKEDPSIKRLSLYDQLKLVYDLDPEAFLENYREASNYTKRGAEFLKTASLPMITAITGNREFDYQAVFDFFADVLGVPRVVYMAEVLECGRFDLHTEPEVKQMDGTGVLLLPYRPPSERYSSTAEESLDRLRDLKSERIAILTHENPCAEELGVPNRKAKMQKTLDEHIAEARKINPDTTLFCGHLDKSFDAIQHDGITIQPISGKEVVVYDAGSGDYSKVTLDQG